ncbi:hypothetical protein SOVF_089020 [Spinacia oleracea]|nr:hypothetical protein SOVF_089020 [Spinacia oleracea]
MESLPLLYRAPHPPTTSFKASNYGSFCFDCFIPKSTLCRRRIKYGASVVRASVDPGSSSSRRERVDGIERSDGVVGGYTGSTMEVTTFNQSFGDAASATAADFPVWDKIGAIVRLSYGIGIYGAMALAGNFICSLSGIDSSGGFQLSFDAIIQGLGYATPPIMALLFILDDEVVKLSPHARAIRDVEDEELRSFFYGMSPWQFILIVAASSVGEELFYRAAVQAGMLPPLVPFAQAFAAVITAALTGSLYYIAASPKDPTYVVAPVLQSRSGREDLKKLFAAWYERRQMKRIYSPLLEGILGLYLGFEWIQTNNILAPIITHGVYSAVVLGHGLWKIHDHRCRLRQRIQQLKSEKKDSAF